jgi:cobalt/nickel transport system permease protein
MVVGIIVSTGLLPDGAWLAFALSWLIVLAAAILGQVGVWFLIVRSFIALPFALMAFSIVFTLPGSEIAVVKLGKWMLVASDAGLIRFFSVLARSLISVQAAILLTLTTTFTDITHGMRHLRVPVTLVQIIAFMGRYLSLLMDQAIKLIRAREARSAQVLEMKPGRTIAWRASVAGNMIGQLFVRSLARSDRIYMAMLARGFDGRFLTVNIHEVRRADWFAASAVLLALIAIQVVGFISH